MTDLPPDADSTSGDSRRPARPIRVVDRGRLLVDAKVLDRIHRHISTDQTVERGGILVGHVVESVGLTIIVDAVSALDSVGAADRLTFTHETWDHVNNVLAERYPAARMVGWYHSHPGFGIFLSEHDQFIHRNFFREAWQVAYVDDPVLGESGFFGWSRGEVVQFRSWGTWQWSETSSTATVADQSTVKPDPEPEQQRDSPSRGRRAGRWIGIVLLGVAAWLGYWALTVADDEPTTVLPTRPATTTTSSGPATNPPAPSATAAAATPTG